MPKRTSADIVDLQTPEFPLLKKLVAKTLLRFHVVGKFVQKHGFYRDSIAILLGVSHLEDEISQDRMGVIDEIYTVCEEIANQPVDYPETLETNLARLRRIVKLDDLETGLLRFAILLHYSPEFDDLFDLFEPMHTARVQKLIASQLQSDVRAVARALSPKSTLALSGLLTVDRGYSSNSMRNKLDLLSQGFADMMMNYEGDDLYEIFKDAVRRVGAPSLGLEDFDHMARERRMMTSYMQKAISTGRRGAHILLYGPPGTGKTEWVKTMTAALGMELYEVSYANEDDEPLSGRSRINAFKSAQYLLAGRPVALMFDEIEDIFEDTNPVPALLAHKPVQSRKGWFNRILETAPVPTVWISNSVEMMDEAMLRRFDLVVKMPLPPTRKRLQIAEKAFGCRVDGATLSAMADHPRAAPAILSRAAEVLALIDPDSEEAGDFASMMVSSTLEAQGHRPLRKPRHKTTGDYDPQLVNCDVDLEAIVEGIVANPSARLCLYGPPGTGKSAFGRWLAERIGRPCLVKQGSDLLSMWVGGTEANIAAAFEEAERESAVLIFDEVDGFLQDRTQAQQSWEVTQVNELLTRMEDFEGIFIATTNLMGSLDPASLRRFDMKMRFGYLRPTQAAAMFEHTCRMVGLENDSPQILERIKSLPNLTPGDFAAVVRQSRFHPLADTADLAKRLAQECAIKDSEKAGMAGFLA